MSRVSKLNIRRHINRNVRGMDRLELWLLSAIVTILAVRLFLEITGYPQVGSSTLHIAHVLWGGLLMALGTIVLFTFVGKSLEAFGVFAGGIGFGLFIDEVGKFVTQDNDYFFQPSVAIMYTVFIFLYMTARWVLTSSHYSQTEYLVNSINEMREIPIGKATEEEKKLILFTLGNSDSNDPLVRELKQVMNNFKPDTEGQLGLFVRWRDGFYRRYRNLACKSWFTKAIAAFFIIQFVGSVSVVLTLMFDLGAVLDQLESFGFSDWAILASNIISAIYIAWGVFLLRRSRLRSYNMFERSILVQLFLGQLFLFYKDEFGAVPGFVFYILLLLAIRFVIQRENKEVIGAAIASGVPMD
ncbi:MAG: hypothetical protein ACYC6Z_07320 [Thermoleophilia bacterium]